MKEHFGYVEDGHHIAVCRSCHAVAYMTAKYRNHLDKVVKCCKDPDYFFHPVYSLEDIELYPTCGQPLPEEDAVEL